MKHGTADWFWPAAERLSIPVMLNAPYTHKEIGEVAERHPRLRIIMNHLGARTTQKDDLLKIATESTATLAKHPNVYVKLTLVPVFSTAPYHTRTSSHISATWSKPSDRSGAFGELMRRRCSSAPAAAMTIA